MTDAIRKLLAWKLPLLLVTLSKFSKSYYEERRVVWSLTESNALVFKSLFRIPRMYGRENVHHIKKKIVLCNAST